MRRVTIRLSGDELESLGVEAVVSVFRAAGLRRVRELRCRRPGCLLVVTVADPVSETELSGLSEVEWWERIDGDGDDVTYLCKIAVPAFEEGFDPYHETEVSPGGMEVADDGIDVTMIGSHEAVSERVREYGDTGTDVLLRTMTDYDGPDEPLDALTDRQREVLSTAFDRGYFQVPREATTEDVGAALGLDPSTVREHLQRAQRNLLSELLDG